MTRRLVVLALVSLGLAACASGGPSPSGPPASGATSAPPSDIPTASAEPTAPTPGPHDPAAIGRAFVEALAGGDLAAAEAMEDGTMRAAAPAAALGQLWAQLVAQLGAFESFGDPTAAEQAPYTIVTVPARFASVDVPLLVTVDAEGRVAGFHVGQPTPAGSPGASPSASPTPSPAAYVADLASWVLGE